LRLGHRISEGPPSRQSLVEGREKRDGVVFVDIAFDADGERDDFGNGLGAA
jgi:hypothetical protein